MNAKEINGLIRASTTEKALQIIAEKAINGERISFEEGVLLYEKGEPGFLGMLANFLKEQQHRDRVFFNRNFHIEPTNICVFDCKFCSYSRLTKENTQDDAWEMSEDEILDIVRSYKDKAVTEAHIVGGVHPKMGLDYFARIIKNIKEILPDIHVKAFTAIELEYMCRKAKVSYKEGLQLLKDHGQDSLPGGGAEIFDEKLRKEICEDKCTTAQWLEIHETAHGIGLPSNATILYGHIETYRHRIDHLDRLRTLQDKTDGFQCFIPLKFRNKNNQMSYIKEVSIIEDLRNYAISRIYLDNFPHLKAYWPMIGKETAQLSLAYGVDDLDGTIDDSTKIYSLAGVQETHPTMTTEELEALIKSVGRQPVERDTLYNTVKDYLKTDLAEG